MSSDFNYKDFIDQLRFQVRGVIPDKYSEHEIYVRDIMYKMTTLAAEELVNETDIDEEHCKYITQIIAEWTFHKTLDMIYANIPSRFHEAILHKINFDIYDFLVEKENDATSEAVIQKIEKLVNKSFKKAVFKLFDAKLINKKVYNSAITNSNIDEMAATKSENSDLYSVPVSILDVIKVNPFITLAYFAVLPLTFITALVSFHQQHLPIGFCALSLFALLLWRFLTRESLISVNIPDEDS